jgi:hypothetical protein
LRDQLDSVSKRAMGGVRESAGMLERKVDALLGSRPGRLEPPDSELALLRLNTNVGTLYGAVGNADVAPTSSQVLATSAMERDFTLLMARWNAIKSSDLTALNHQLSSAGLPEVRIESNSRPEEESEDEE